MDKELLNILIIGNRAVKKAHKESLEKGIPNVYCTKDGVLYFQLPDGTITTKMPEIYKKMEESQYVEFFEEINNIPEIEEFKLIEPPDGVEADISLKIKLKPDVNRWKAQEKIQNIRWNTASWIIQ
ncbi:MAG: hypothetical protein Q9M89_08285 [Persephonella sp.]|nr:hypothetical protein [Persephonella sp.]